MGRGRPSKYKKQYCTDLVEHMSSGGSYETFGAYIGEKYGSEMMVSKQTLYDWEKKHPEFLDSIFHQKHSSLNADCVVHLCGV